MKNVFSVCLLILGAFSATASYATCQLQGQPCTFANCKAAGYTGNSTWWNGLQMCTGAAIANTGSTGAPKINEAVISKTPPTSVKSANPSK